MKRKEQKRNRRNRNASPKIGNDDFYSLILMLGLCALCVWIGWTFFNVYFRAVFSYTFSLAFSPFIRLLLNIVIFFISSVQCTVYIDPSQSHFYPFCCSFSPLRLLKIHSKIPISCMSPNCYGARIVETSAFAIK